MEWSGGLFLFYCCSSGVVTYLNSDGALKDVTVADILIYSGLFFAFVLRLFTILP